MHTTKNSSQNNLDSHDANQRDYDPGSSGARTLSVRNLQKWFKNHITDDGCPYTLDKNQAKIVIDEHKHTLVTARAGSGKTRTIVAKAVYLLAYQKISPEQIIIFSFNRKARAEVNERLHQIKFDGQPVLAENQNLATTFHAFAYKLLGGKDVLGSKLIGEFQQNQLLNELCAKRGQQIKADELKQFIARAEQQFFTDYQELDTKINNLPNTEAKAKLLVFNEIFFDYRAELEKRELTNFNRIMAGAAAKISDRNIGGPDARGSLAGSSPRNHSNHNSPKLNYQYVFVDEYQDFSKLFLTLIKALLKTCKNAKFLAVGDDWQSINRFAGSNVDYFLHFEKYFAEDHAKLFIPTNYRSGRRIVTNANFFMGKALSDYNGCKSGNKLKAKIYYKNINYGTARKNEKIPLLIENYLETTVRVIKNHPGKSVKILSRNNNLHIPEWSLERFINLVSETCIQQKIIDEKEIENRVTFSTIHRSKGLESDIVILMEIDENKFPAPDKTGGLYAIFGDTAKTLFQDEARLFYVALTRPKEKLYILSKTTKINKENKKYNFFHYLNEEYLEELSG